MHQLAAWSKRRVRTFRKEAGCVHVHWCRLTYRLIRDIYDDLKRNWDNMKQRSELTHNIENIVITQYMLQIVRTSGLYQYQLLHHIPPCLTELLVHKFLSIWDPVTLKVHLKFDNILPITQHTGNLDASLSGHNIQLNILKSLWQKATLAELFKIWCGSQSKKMAKQYSCWRRYFPGNDSCFQVCLRQTCHPLIIPSLRSLQAFLWWNCGSHWKLLNGRLFTYNHTHKHAHTHTQI